MMNEQMTTPFGTMEETYRLRLSLETDIAWPKIDYELNRRALREEKAQLRRVIAACPSEEDYAAWKQTYIDTEPAKFEGERFLTCTYHFIGYGTYEAVVPESDMECFRCWIKGNGSAFHTGTRDSTCEEIVRYLCLSAANGIPMR